MKRRRFAASTIGVLCALFFGSCSDGSGPPEQIQGAITVVARFNDGVQLVDPGQAHIQVSVAGNAAPLIEATVSIPAGADSLVHTFVLDLAAASQQFDVTIELLHRTSGQVVFRIGPTTVTVTEAGTRAVAATFPYVGAGSSAAGIRFVSTATGVLGGDSVLFTAEAFDGAGAAIPGTPILWTSSDTNSARIANRAIGRVVAANVRATVQVSASLLPTQASPTPPSQSANLAIQPQPTAIQIQAGNNQTGIVGAALPAQIRARVVAGDNVGVQGIAVAFAVTGGGGAVSATLDTTDASGDVSVTWTLGGATGAHAVSATVTSLPAAVVNFGATGSPGAAAKLAFVQEPSAVIEGLVMSPAVTVRAVDQFGNPTPLFAGDVTLALLSPGGATLSGTLTRTALTNLALFDNLSINMAGTYQLRATSGALASDTSAAFNVLANVPAEVTFEVQPAGVRAGASFNPSVVVAVRNGVGQIITTSNGLPVTLALGINPGAGTLSGTATVNTINGLATFPGLSINKAASGYALVASSGSLTRDTSSAFTVAPDSARSLAFATQPSSVRFEAPFGVTVEARDQFGNVSPEIAGSVTVALGTNPSGGTLSGTLSAAPVQGVATFTGLSIDNVGNGYTLGATGTGVTAAASNSINIVAPTNGSAWINPAGGLWSVGANWSGGVVPGAADTVFIRRSGTYTVTLDAGAAHPRVDVGGPSGTQSLVIAGAVTLNAGAGGIAVNQRGRLILDGTATLAGSAATIHSQSTLTKSGSGTASLQAPYDFDGQVLIQAGTLSLSQGALAGSTASGAFVLSAGTTLDFSGGVHTLDAAGSVSGAGTVLLSGTSQVDAAGSWTLTGALTISGGTLNYAAATGTAGAVTLSAGSLGVAGSGVFTATGATTWSGGNLTGTGTLRVAATGSLSISGASARSMTGTTLDILATADVPSSATITMAGGAVLRVGTGVSMTIPGILTLSQGLGPPALFQNLGTVTRNTSAGAVNIGVPYDNDGQTTVSSGTLRLQGGSGSGTAAGNYTVAATTTLEFGTAHSLSGAVSGAGTVLVNAGIVTTTGTWAVTGTTNVSTGTFNYSGATAGSTAQLTLAGGSLGGTGVFNVSTAMTWSGGDLLDAGTTRVMAGGTLAITGARNHSARLLEVLGNTTMSGSFVLNSGNGATIRNGAGATFTITGDPVVQHTLGGAVPVFENLGSVVRNTSAGTATLGMRFDHSGSALTVSTGTLVLGAGGTQTGPVTLSAGTFLDYSGGTFTLSNTVSGTGTARLQSGTIANNTTADTARYVNLVLNGGTLAPVGGVVVSGSMTWTGDAGLTGTGTVRVPAAVTLNITGAGAKLLTNGFLRNDGTIVYSGAGAINTGLNAQITNNGLFNWTGDGSILSSQGGVAARFVNSAGGTLRRSTSANAAVLGMTMNKLGAFDIQTGSLELREGSQTNFTGAVTGTGLLKLAGTARTYTASGNMTLAGAVEVSDADLVLGGRVVTVTGSFATSNAGSLTMTNAADSLSIGGSATFGGGATSGKLTNGVIAVAGSFTQSGNPASFAATVAHRVRFNGAGVTQTVTFANSTASFFDSVIVDKGAGARSAVRLASDMRVNRGLVVRGSSEINSTASGQLKVGGKLRVVSGGTNPLVRPFVLELGDAPDIDSMAVATDGIEPDTLVYVGNVIEWRFGTPIRHKNVRIAVNGTIKPVQSDFGSIQTLNGDVVVTGGTLEWDAFFDELHIRKLKVAGGTLLHTGGTIDAADSAVITGGNATLNGGVLKLGGHVRQSAGQITGTGQHTTLIGAVATQRITMTNAGHGTGQSFFGKFALDNESTGGIDLVTSVAARILATTGNTNPRLFGNGNRVFTKGMAVGSGSFSSFNNVAIESDTGEVDDDFNFVTFSNPSQNLVFFTVRRLGGTSRSYNGLNFPGTNAMKLVNARYVRPERIGLVGIFTMSISGTPQDIDNDTCFEGVGGDVVWNGTNMACNP